MMTNSERSWPVAPMEWLGISGTVFPYLARVVPVSLTAALKLTGSTAGLVSLRDPGGPGRMWFEDGTRKIAGEVCGWTCGAPERAAFTADVAAMPEAVAGSPMEGAKVRYVLVASIRSGGESFGQLVLGRSGRAYSDRDLDLARQEGETFGCAASCMMTQPELAFLRTVIQNIGDAVTVTDPENRILFVNEAFRKMYGYSDAEVIGQPVEVWNRKKDGTEFPVRLSTTPIKNEKGQTVAWVGVTTDITELKRAEAAQAQQLDILATINEIALELTSLPVSADLYDYLAKTLKKLTGAVLVVASEFRAEQQALRPRRTECDPESLRTAEGMLGSDIREMLCKVDQHTYETLIAQRVGYRGSLSEVTLGAVPPPVARRVQAALNIERFVIIRYAYQGTLFGTSTLGFRRGVEVPRRELLESFSSLAAVSLRRQRAEQAMHESERAYRTLFEQSPYSVALTDMDVRIVDVNEKACQAMALSREKMIGKTVTELGAFEPALLATMKQALLTDGILDEYEVTLRFHGGREAAVRVSAKIIDLGGTPHILTIIEDISQRKEEEARRRKLEEQLFQARKLESVGRLAGGVAHDFNNLLTVINGYSALLLGRMTETDPLRHTVSEIEKAGNRAAGLVRQLLAFSRKQLLRPQAVDLNQVVRDVEKMLARLIGEDVQLETRLGASLGPIWVDPHQLEQVIVNLAANARDAMPQGGRLRIETDRAEVKGFCQDCSAAVAEGSYARLTVSDSGVGMSEEVRAKVFEPFFTTKDVGQGTGLGLATVHGIVAQSGGHIDVLSAPGTGTTFHIYFPITGENPAEN
jgi:PAS domain S-box-containing protein